MADALTPADLDLLLRCRLVIARVGEMDMFGWWNTKGLLGRSGATVLARGFPNTHRFAQARTVFAVARARCREVYALQDAVTLWDLPAEVEAFAAVEAMPKTVAIPEALTQIAGIPTSAVDRLESLRRGPDGRSVPITGITAIESAAIGVLACAFARGEQGQLAVPVARRGAA